MHPALREEFRRLRDNAGDKLEKLLRIAFKQTRLRKRLNIAAGVMALLSAASITALLGDFTSALAIKIVAAIFSTASGLISLMVNTGYKENEVAELNIGAAGYLNLRERAHRIPLDPKIDDVAAYSALGELQDLYGELDVKFQRYVIIERWATGTGGGETIVFGTGSPPSSAPPHGPARPLLYYGERPPDNAAPRRRRSSSFFNSLPPGPHPAGPTGYSLPIDVGADSTTLDSSERSVGSAPPASTRSDRPPNE